MLLWGGGWTALKILTVSVDVEVLTFWRFLIMTLAFIPILIYLKKPLRLPLKSLPYIFGSSILNVLFMFFAYLGVERSTAGSGGVIITVLAPLLTFVLSILIMKTKYDKRHYMGLLIGILGGSIMLNIQDINGFLQGGELYFVLAAATWAGVTFLAQKSHLHIHSIHYSFFIACFAMVILSLINISNDITLVFDQDSRFWSALIYLGVFAQSLATTIYFIASRKLGSSSASSYMLLVPLFALVIGYLVLNEPIEIHVVLGGCISLVSVYLMNKRREPI